MALLHFRPVMFVLPWAALTTWGTSGCSDDASSAGAGGAATGGAGAPDGGTPSGAKGGKSSTGGNGMGGGGGPSGQVTDVDGNVYDTIELGGEIWLLQDLHVRHYRNGDAIPAMTPGVEWEKPGTGAYSEYESPPDDTYGLLYNFWAVEDERGLCPEGFRVPHLGHWEDLIEEQGGSEVAGGNLKEAGTLHWAAPNEGATNASGFTALPAGIQFGGGMVYARGYSVYYWTTNTSGDSMAFVRGLQAHLSTIDLDVTGKRDAIAVRCVAE